MVTGGSRGLGLAIVRTLAAAGHEVTAVARSRSDGLDAAIAASGAGSIDFQAFDLAETDRLGELARALRKGRAPIFGLVNNAGIGIPGVLGVMGDADVERLFRLNAISPILLTKYLGRSMMLAKAGRVVNMSSVVALTGYAGLSVYSATKAALIGFTRSYAREVGGLGITVNAIAPGFAATEMTGELDQAAREKIARRSALRRLIEPEDVAQSVEFLIGEGGRHVTGTVLTVDAGNTA